MAGQVSYTSHDYQSIHIVPVIASFDTEGNITPLYVRLNHQAFPINSFWVRSHFLNTLEFNCQIQDGDYLKPLLLVYYKAEDIWAIPQV